MLLLTSSPPDIWHDANALTLMGIVVAIIFGVAGLIVGIFAVIYPIRNQKRKIEWWCVSEAPVVTFDKTMTSRIQVLLDGKPAEHTRLRVIEVKNTGNTVRSEDYFEPLIFEFSEEVISGEVLDTGLKNPIKPSDHGSFLTLGLKSVQLPPFPLRRGEAIRFAVLLKGESKLNVRGRIDGAITEFDPLGPTVSVRAIKIRLIPVMINVLLILLGIGLILFFSQYPLPGDVQKGGADPFGGALGPNTSTIVGNSAALIGVGLCLSGLGTAVFILTFLNLAIKIIGRKGGGR